ncbi:hypothetical protein BC781_1011053 [Sediminitomix flava]|uniref:Uncharacterized protein n=2 Tax=Sediminitomix flava TaxID=379075 RepID=A0A315ZHB1_SEDFL|nr:hypothetical protein BC781_1011053 [Sediminitomix flava]
MSNTSEIVSTFSELDQIQFEGLINDDSFGLLGYGESPLGQSLKGRFRWFEKKEELIKFLHEDFAKMVLSDGEMTNAFQEQYLRIINHLQEGDMCDVIAPLNHLFNGAWHLQWIGSFRKLCLGADNESKQIRATYTGVMQMTSDSSPITNPSEKEAFRDFVKRHSF